MNHNELTKLLQFSKKENDLFMPNEIFNELKKSLRGNSSHISFAYSYTYLTTWLYRYAKYGDKNMIIDQKKLKEILGYSPSYKKVDFIIKKDGLLEQMKILETTTDYPVFWIFEDKYEGVKFEYLSDFKDDEMYPYIHIGKNFKVKRPIRAFTRHVYDEESIELYENEGYEDGTFYELHNTHLIPFEVFLYSMSNKDVGVIGFYLWSYLKMKCQIYNGGYDVSFDELEIETGISRSTVAKYLKSLKQYRMVSFYHNQECFSLALKDEDKKANTYITNNYELFTSNPIPYDKIKVISKEEYYKSKMSFNVNLGITLEQLPY